MTDLDALARRIARIYAEDDEELACESEIKDALEVAHTAGRAEGFAEGARGTQFDLQKLENSIAERSLDDILRDLAEKARQGGKESDSWWNSGLLETLLGYPADARFIATCSPALIIVLVEMAREAIQRAEKAEAEVSRLTAIGQDK